MTDITYTYPANPDTIPEPMRSQQIAAWKAIESHRDARRFAGVQVGGYWFHTDPDSRNLLLGIKDQARDVLASGGTMVTVLQKLGQDIQWKTLSGPRTPMTVQLSFTVVSAIGDLDAICHYVGDQHESAMRASSDPTNYDFSAGWPESFPG